MVLTAGQVLTQATARIGATDARVLLCHVLQCSHASLIAHPERVIDDVAARYLGLVDRRVDGVPVAYLTGSREFYSREFVVTPDVLIPRPETELLVDLALERLPSDADASVLDLGTGTGCIGITIALEHPRTDVLAVDASEAALDVARDNMQRLGAERIRFIRGLWFDVVGGERYDLIVSNPPYVADEDPHLAQGDVRFEPSLALTSGPDGLDALRLIVGGAPGHLLAGGWLLVEHGYDQGAVCRSLFQSAGLAKVATWPDLAGTERVTGGCRIDVGDTPR